MNPKSTTRQIENADQSQQLTVWPNLVVQYFLPSKVQDCPVEDKVVPHTRQFAALRFVCSATPFLDMILLHKQRQSSLFAGVLIALAEE